MCEVPKRSIRVSIAPKICALVSFNENFFIAYRAFVDPWPAKELSAALMKMTSHGLQLAETLGSEQQAVDVCVSIFRAGLNKQGK